jgi:hypothetical protein
VTGELGGGQECAGTFSYDGTIDAGATCTLTSFHGRARGLPRVTSFEGNGLTLFGPARLKDRDGNVVGSENANSVTQYNLDHVGDCNTPPGFTKGTFSSVIVLNQAQG